MIDQYMELNNELRSLLFTIEKRCGLKVGGGRVFTDVTKRREIADVKHIFIFVSIKYLGYTHRQVMGWLSINYISNVTYALKRLPGLIEHNTAYRNRLYNIAIENGVMELIYDIINIVDNSKNERRA